MEPKRPQLNLDELHQLKWLLGGALVLLSVWTVFYLDFEAWTLMGLTTLAVGAALIWPGLPARFPALAHKLVFPAVVLFFIGDLVLTRQVLPAIVRLDILLLLYRGVSYRQKRDDLQVIILGLFLIVVAGVLTVSLVFAVQILVFTACALGFLLVITLVEAAETGLIAPKSPGRPAWSVFHWRKLLKRVREVADWRVVTLGAVLFVGVVGVSALLFLAIPRFQLENSLFLERFAAKKARTGFNDTIKFGDVTEIQQDTSVALSVDVTDRSKIPAAPYWRMLVLDEYKEGTFRVSPAIQLREFGRASRIGDTVRGTARARSGEPVYWTFYFESGVSRYLPLLGPFTQLRFREMQNFRVAANLGVVALREEPATMTAYRVEGMQFTDTLPDAHFALRLLHPPANDKLATAVQMTGLTLVPADVITLRKIVAEITGGAQLPVAEFARRTNDWLAKQHTYSLKPNVPSGSGDPLVRWMTSQEPGHCELFAGSFVLLARAAGHPARVVIGFRGGTWNGYSNNFTIRNSEAHAWCEVFDPATAGWLRADPTPGAVVGPTAAEKGEATLARRTDRGWGARLESLRVFWYRRIVNFDQHSQTEALESVKQAAQSAREGVGAKFSELVERLKAWLTTPWTTERVVKVLVALAAIIGAGWAWREFGRGWWNQLRRDPGHGRLDPVRAKAGTWLRALAQGGDFPEIENVRQELERLRFGARVTWPEPELVFRRARQVLRAARRPRPVTAA